MLHCVLRQAIPGTYVEEVKFYFKYTVLKFNWSRNIVSRNIKQLRVCRLKIRIHIMFSLKKMFQKQQLSTKQLFESF